MRQEEPISPDVEDQMVRVIVAAMRAFAKGDAPLAPRKPLSEVKPNFWLPPEERSITTKRALVEAELAKDPEAPNKPLARKLDVSESYIRDIKRDLSRRGKA